MKMVTLQQTGYYIEGQVNIILWTGDIGELYMDPMVVPLGNMTKENLMKCINDGQYGAQFIDKAELAIYDYYENNYKEFNRYIDVNEYFCKKYQSIFCKGIKKKVDSE